MQVLRPEVDALTQAQLLVDAVIALAPGDLPPALEVVSTGGENAATIATSVGLWVGYVEAELGLKPVVYTSRYFWQDSVGSVDYSNHPLWIADYSSPACPNLPTQWSDWVFWQDSSTGSVSGISVAVNTDYFNGDHAALTAIGQPAQCDAEPCPLFADGFEPPVSAAVEIIASRSSR